MAGLGRTNVATARALDHQHLEHIYCEPADTSNTAVTRMLTPDT